MRGRREDGAELLSQGFESLHCVDLNPNITKFYQPTNLPGPVASSRRSRWLIRSALLSARPHRSESHARRKCWLAAAGPPPQGPPSAAVRAHWCRGTSTEGSMWARDGAKVKCERLDETLRGVALDHNSLRENFITQDLLTVSKLAKLSKAKDGRLETY